MLEHLLSLSLSPPWGNKRELAEMRALQCSLSLLHVCVYAACDSQRLTSVIFAVPACCILRQGLSLETTAC